MELEPYYEKGHFRFKMATAGERNRVMKLLLMNDVAGVEQAVVWGGG